MKKNAEKFTKIKCCGCGNEVDKPKKEIDRQIKKGHTNFYCSKNCVVLYLKRPSKHKEIISNCLTCGKEFKTTTKLRASKTCSISCATKLGLSNLSEDKIRSRSDKIKEHWKNGTFSSLIKNKNLGFSTKKSGKQTKRVYEISSICIVCNNNFISKSQTPSKPNKTCSKECYSQLCSKNAKANPNCGGETNYKRYHYKGIIMDSSWEVELAQWLDEKQIKWIRDRKLCLYWKDEAGEQRRYYPDFYLPDFNCYLDPKNKYLQQKDAFKLNAVREQGIKLFDGYLDNIKSEIQYLIIGNLTLPVVGN